jgi:hypothetical protein
MRSQDQDTAKERKTTSPSKTQRLHKLLAQSGLAPGEKWKNILKRVVYM